MIYLVLSDIHANREALEAVARQTAGRYDAIVCLGDVVGYGPDPTFAIDWLAAQPALTILRGNHDKAALGLTDLADFNPAARAAAQWTARQLDATQQAWLRNLPAGPLTIEQGDVLLCHGSPYDEDEYVARPEEAARVLSPHPDAPMLPLVTLFGHTHVQGGFAGVRSFPARPTQRVPGAAGSQGGVRLMLEMAPRYLLNPGAVGQPRDGDPRAAYAYFDLAARTITYHRAPYDVAATQQKIMAAKLPQRLADRLALGR